MMHCDVLIIGAGPAGLVMAFWLSKLGVKVRMVDKTAEPGTTSRALAVQPRTLELYRQFDWGAYHEPWLRFRMAVMAFRPRSTSARSGFISASR
jgi:2-polyprenyl-6-methoxyphenol hydroxylase-like FAD-dependent oxidoreductase